VLEHDALTRPSQPQRLLEVDGFAALSDHF
jgi:hypothetical protein